MTRETVDDTIATGGYYTLVLDGKIHNLVLNQSILHFRARAPRPADYSMFQYGADLFIPPPVGATREIILPSGWERLGGVTDNPVTMTPTGPGAHFVMASSHHGMIRFNLRWYTP